MKPIKFPCLYEVKQTAYLSLTTREKPDKRGKTSPNETPGRLLLKHANFKIVTETN
jgi:hypothetical protein